MTDIIIFRLKQAKTKNLGVNMVVDDAHFMTLLKGKRIKLTLKSSSFMGVVQRINPNKTLVLADG